jgi:hypothetical protein
VKLVSGVSISRETAALPNGSLGICPEASLPVYPGRFFTATSRRAIEQAIH